MCGFRQAAITSFLLAVAAAIRADEPPNFDSQIAPLLASHCLECHSGTDPKGGLDLSRAESAARGGESGAGIVPGKLSESQVWLRVEAGEMPPKRPLPQRDRSQLQAWIRSGAKWGTDPLDPFRFSTRARAGYDWWSLQPLSQPPPPAAVKDPRVQNAVDAFVLDRLQTAGLKPSAEAERRVLIRRLHFDLLGLPPSKGEIEAFEQDATPDAYERLVDRLLASPHYGERWARHWLDVARFGESDGFEYDRMRPHAWRYRDWVIAALNRDLPYDEFARRQIAGDVGPFGDEEGLAAVGFLVAGAYDGLMPQSEPMRAVMRHDELEDLVGTTSQSFLGLTVHCARCHDHKFDPVSQVDYYRLEAALAGVKRGNRELVKQVPPAWLMARREALHKSIELAELRARSAVIAQREQNRLQDIAVPQPLAHWSFDRDGRDEIGELDLELLGGAKIERGRLQLDGKASFARSPPLSVDLKEKTIEAWLQPASLDQRGGGVLTVETLDGEVFDSVVYAERSPRTWLAGSDFFRRTQDAGGPEEKEADKQVVHVAIVYHADGKIALYRNGLAYGKAYASNGPVAFKAGASRVLLGLRHSPAAEGKLFAGAIDRAQLYDRALSAAEIAASAGVESVQVSEEELAAAMSDAETIELGRLKQQLHSVTDQLERWREPKVFSITPQSPPPTHLLVRGNPQQRGDQIPPASLASIGGESIRFALPALASDAERRTALATWISHRDNPLFARTMTNRLWHHHFGRGLVATPNDLGFSGGQPSHPELLDWLAAELIRHEFSLKAMHRLILTSATYRQQSLPGQKGLAGDADNRLLWRMSPRRLDAESLRDFMLAASNQLNACFGGPGFQDFQPFNRSGTQFYKPADRVGPEFQRRTIYRMWARGGKNPVLDAFDCPDPSTTSPQRGATTTPQQALSLMNNEFTLRMADALAAELERQHAHDIGRQVNAGFEHACGRSATEAELEPCIALARKHGLAAFCRVLFNSNSFLYID